MKEFEHKQQLIKEQREIEAKEKERIIEEANKQKELKLKLNKDRIESQLEAGERRLKE